MLDFQEVGIRLNVYIDVVAFCECSVGKVEVLGDSFWVERVKGMESIIICNAKVTYISYVTHQ